MTNTQPEHKSIEEARKEFEDILELKFSEYFVKSDLIAVNDSVVEKVTEFEHFLWNYIKPRLNSRNLLERFVKWLEGEMDTESFEINRKYADEDSGQLVTTYGIQDIKSKLDEFIESELGK